MYMELKLTFLKLLFYKRGFVAYYNTLLKLRNRYK